MPLPAKSTCFYVGIGHGYQQSQSQLLSAVAEVCMACCGSRPRGSVNTLGVEAGNCGASLLSDALKN